MVSFTGRYDAIFLQKVDGSTQTVAPNQEPQQDLTRLAQIARDRLWLAESLQRRKLKGGKKLTGEQQALVEALDRGTLHTEANDATRKSGWGRIKHRDGTFEDLALHNGGIVRTVLDDVVVEEISEAEEPNEKQSPNWQ